MKGPDQTPVKVPKTFILNILDGSAAHVSLGNLKETIRLAARFTLLLHFVSAFLNVKVHIQICLYYQVS